MLALAILLALGPVAQPNLPSPEGSAFRDLRIASDQMSFSFSSLTGQDATWFVAEIRPDPDCCTKDPTDKREIPSLWVHGAIVPEVPLAGKMPGKTLKYRWETFVMNLRPNPEERSVSSAFFRRGGNAICRLRPEFDQIPVDIPVAMLPEEWKKFVAPAWEKYRKNAEIFDPKTAGKHLAALEEMLGDDNPMLALAAAQALGKAGLLDVKRLDAMCKPSADIQQALWAYLILRYAPTKERAAALERLQSRVRSAKQAADYRGVALAAAVCRGESPGGFLYRAGYDILALVDKKQITLGEKTADNRYIAALLKKAKLPATQPPSPEDVVLRDLRLAWNQLSFSFASLNEKDATWFVAAIRPDPDSYTYINNPLENRVFRLLWVHGAVLPEVPLSGKMPTKPLEFRWEIPRAGSERNPENRSASSLFRRRGGLAICRLFPEEKEIPVHLPVVMLPEDWKKFVAPAWEKYRKDPEIFDAKTAVKHRAALEKLLGDDNPMLALAAAQALGEAELLDVKQLDARCKPSADIQQALWAYLCVRFAPTEQRDAVVERLQLRVRSAKQAADYRGIALAGAICRGKNPRSFVYRAGKDLLEAVDKKQRALGEKTAEDRYITALLTLVDVRKKEPKPQP